MEFISKITDYFLDSDTKFLSKFSLFILGVMTLLSIDYFFRFSDSYISKNKIEQIEKIEQILQNDTLRIEAKTELINIENEVIKRKAFWTHISPYFSFESLYAWNSKSENQTTPQYATNKKITSIIDERSNLIHNLTSGWVFWLLIILTPFIFIGNKFSSNAFVGALFMDLTCIIFAYFFSYLFAFIPIIYNPIINYILNVLLCLFIVGLFAKIADKLKKTT